MSVITAESKKTVTVTAQVARCDRCAKPREVTKTQTEAIEKYGEAGVDLDGWGMFLLTFRQYAMQTEATHLCPDCSAAVATFIGRGR